MIARLYLIIFVALQAAPAVGSDITWTVVNPFRYYKYESSFLVHKAAYDAIIAQNGGVRPANIVEQVERRLNTQ